ncbi:MAG: hypothetical protein U0165_15210 [Polyangiaceae bacterium]
MTYWRGVRMHARWVLGLVGLGAVTMSSCSDSPPTAIVVVASSDTVVTAACDTLVVTAKRDGFTRFEKTYRLPTDASLPGTLTFVRSMSMSEGSLLEIDLDAKVAATGKTRVSRRARLGFIDGKTKLLRMTLRGECLDVTCPAGQTCDGGACVPIDLDVNDLPDAPEDPLQDIVFPQGVPIENVSAPSNNASERASISADGRYVAFESMGSNLIEGGTFFQQHIYVRDRKEKTTSLVSVSDLGQAGNLDSTAASISADGRYVAFSSSATNLVADDDNNLDDVFVHDRLTGQTLLVSASVTGKAANGRSTSPAISASGRFVAFVSEASDLVLGDVNGVFDIYVRDMQTGVTVRVSVGAAGQNTNGKSWGAAISGTGRYIAFVSEASNLVANDTNGVSDVFVRDMQLGTTTLVSATSSGVPGSGASDGVSMSADGQVIAYATVAPELAGYDVVVPQVVLLDRNTGVSARVSGADAPANGLCESTSLSANGKRVVYSSTASNLVSGDTNDTADVFVYDVDTKQTRRVSLTSSGGESLGFATEPKIAATGSYVVYTSTGPDVVEPGYQRRDGCIRGARRVAQRNDARARARRCAGQATASNQLPVTMAIEATPNAD